VTGIMRDRYRVQAGKEEMRRQIWVELASGVRLREHGRVEVMHRTLLSPPVSSPHSLPKGGGVGGPHRQFYIAVGELQRYF